MLLFTVFLIIVSCSLLDGFFLAQTFQPLPGEENAQPTVDSEIFEKPTPELGKEYLPNLKLLKSCNPRTDFSKWNKSIRAKPGARFNQMGDPNSIRYLVTANWEGTLPLDAIAFYSTINCEEDSLAMVIRFFSDKDIAEIVQLTESYVPRMMTAWKAISFQIPPKRTPDLQITALALSMDEGTVFIPTPVRSQIMVDEESDMERIYCTGLVHRIIWPTYNITTLRRAGTFALPNLILRVRDQIRSSEDPDRRKHKFECNPLPQDCLLYNPLGEKVIEPDTQVFPMIPVSLRSVPKIATAEELVDSIIRSDYPWDSRVGVEEQRVPDQIVDAILDLDDFDGRQRIVTLSGVASAPLRDAPRRKRNPKIPVADLDVMEIGNRQFEQDPNVVILPKKLMKPSKQTIPRACRVGKISKRIVELLGDLKDPSEQIDNSLGLPENNDEHSSRKDMRYQADYVFKTELDNILSRFRRIQRGQAPGDLEALPAQTRLRGGNQGQNTFEDVTREQIIKNEDPGSLMAEYDENLGIKQEEQDIKEAGEKVDEKFDDGESIKAEYNDDISVKEEEPTHS
ncbi:hypothetical protein TWF730_002869 [Orbilia blumenaviensis]|uniref:Uncharacterized protein n=1 Tax=Orbilia blumenaviensis TaxID=1796055 RepID=A0AAV9U7D4_9PEZI